MYKRLAEVRVTAAQRTVGVLCNGGAQHGDEGGQLGGDEGGLRIACRSVEKQELRN